VGGPLEHTPSLNASMSRAGRGHRESVYPVGSLPFVSRSGEPVDVLSDIESASYGSGSLSPSENSGSTDGRARALRGLRKGEKRASAPFSTTIAEDDDEVDDDEVDDADSAANGHSGVASKEEGGPDKGAPGGE
jgi:hypothetical protein